MLGEDDGFNVATDCEVGDNAHPAWRKQRNEVVQNGVGRRFVADLPVAIFVDIEL